MFRALCWEPGTGPAPATHRGRRESGWFRTSGHHAAVERRYRQVYSRLMSLTLYGSEMWNSPYVMSCFVALREKGLPFDMRVVSLDRGAQHEAAYVEVSLTSRVPALVDGDLTISESSAIVEYLE